MGEICMKSIPPVLALALEIGQGGRGGVMDATVTGDITDEKNKINIYM